MEGRGHIEPVVGILRIGGAYGEAYSWAVLVRYLSPTEVRLEAITRAPTRAEWRAVRRVLKEAGIEKFSFTRRKGGKGVRESDWEVR